MPKKYIGLFIPLPPELAGQFPSLAPKDKSPPHVTFFFVGDVAKGREAEFLDVLRGAFQDSGLEPPVRATLDRPEYFKSPNDGRVAVMRVQFNQDMARFRNRILRALQAADFPVKDSFPYVYRPHTTLAYLPDDEDYKGKIPEGSWDFDTIEVWGLGDYTWGDDAKGTDYAMKIPKTAFRGKETRTYTITGYAEILDRLEKVLKAASILGSWGASREIKFFVDGDGADRISVEELEDLQIKNFEDVVDNDVITISDSIELTPRDDMVSRVASRWMRELVGR